MPRYKDKTILKPTKDSFGYYVIYLYKNKQRKIKKTHRLVAENFINNPENKPMVNHIDGNKGNNKIDNLEWVTARENNLHATHTGLAAGHKHNKSKLTKKDVLFIRENYKPHDKNFNSQVLAGQFKINRGNILKVAYGETYKNDGGKIHKKGSNENE